MRVERRAEHITYYPDRIEVGWSIRYYDQTGELISTGFIVEEEAVGEGEKPHKALERARKRLDERMRREQRRERGEEVSEEGAGRA